MGSKKKISKHPNPYLLAEEIKTQLKEGCDTAVAETLTCHNKKVRKDYEKLQKSRKGLMKDLSKRNIDLETYLVAMGARTLEYQPSVMEDPDPLADIESADEDDDDLENLGLGSGDNSLDEENPIPEAQTLSPEPTIPTPPTVSASSRPKPSSKSNHNKKGKRTKQKPVPESEDSFLHVESLADPEAPFHASVGGDDLRQLRREAAAAEETEDSSSSALSAAAMASAGITVLSRFISRSSASRSSPRRSSVGRRLSINRRTSSISLPQSSENPPASNILSSAQLRAGSLGFQFSSTQPFTKGDGNCMLYAIWDQMQKCKHPLLSSLKSPHDLRLHICSKLFDQLDKNFIFWVQNFSPETWLENMRKNSFWCDDVFIQIVANILNTNIILIPLSPSSAHHAGMYLDVRSVHGGTGDPFYMLYFEEWRTAGHYQSLEPNPNFKNNRVIAHFNWRSCTQTSINLSSVNHPPTLSQTASSPPSPSSPPAPPTPPPQAVPAQLHSTRQRIESEGTLQFSQVVSPIRNGDIEQDEVSDQSGAT